MPMLIGKDFDKVEFDFNGWHLLEPNAFIGDTLIFIVASYLYFKISLKTNDVENVFLKSWKLFFLVFGFGFLVGGFGHLFYNYWGVQGKYPSWYLGIIASFCIEWAMVSIHPKEKAKKLLGLFFILKNSISLIGLTLLITFANLESNPHNGMIFPTINSVLGLGIALGYLGYYYSKQLNPNFKYLWISALIMFPSAIAQAFKISIHPWFDRNDIGHLLLIISMFFYYQAISKVYLNKSLKLVRN